MSVWKTLLFCFLLYSVTQPHDWKHVACRNGRHRSRKICLYDVNTDCLVQQEVQQPSDTEVQSLAVVSHVWASPASGAQGHPKPRLSCFIMFIEVRSKAKKPKAFVRTGCQQDQELLDDSLKEKKKPKRQLTSTSVLHRNARCCTVLARRQRESGKGQAQAFTPNC